MLLVWHGIATSASSAEIATARDAFLRSLAGISSSTSAAHCFTSPPNFASTASTSGRCSVADRSATAGAGVTAGGSAGAAGTDDAGRVPGRSRAVTVPTRPCVSSINSSAAFNPVNGVRAVCADAGSPKLSSCALRDAASHAATVAGSLVRIRNGCACHRPACRRTHAIEPPLHRTGGHPRVQCAGPAAPTRRGRARLEHRGRHRASRAG